MLIEGRYRVMGPLFKSGMVEVFRALDEQIEREVAIRRLLTDELAPAEKEELRLELQGVAALDHPHLLGVLDWGEHQGRPWLVTELVRGETLVERVARAGVLEAEVAIRVFVELSNALVHAHERGVYHRDVRPENVLLTPTGQPYLTEFGMSQLVQRQTNARLSSGERGAPAFLAPEQVRDEGCGSHTDVYSLAGTLFYALTGAPPYDLPGLLDALQGSGSEPRLSGHGVAAPRGLERLIERGLTLDVESRLQTAAEFRDGLRAIDLNELPSSATRLPRGLKLALASFATLLIVLVLVAVELARRTSALADSVGEPSRDRTSSTPPARPDADATPAPAPSATLAPLPRPSVSIPEAKDALIVEARSAMERFEPRAARLLLEAGRERWPGEAKLSKLLIQAQVQAGEYKQALDLLTRGRELAPSVFETFSQSELGQQVEAYGSRVGDCPVPGERWQSLFGARWRVTGDQVDADLGGIGPFRLAVLQDPRAPRVPREIEVELRIQPEAEVGPTYAGIAFGARAANDLFVLYLIRCASDGMANERMRERDAATYERKHGAPPTGLRLLRQSGPAAIEFWTNPPVRPLTKEWTHLRVTFDDLILRVYVNGVLELERDLPRAPDGALGLAKFYETPVSFRRFAVR